MQLQKHETSTTTREPRQLVVRIAGAAGQVIEVYDFTLYGYLAVFLAPHYFPAKSEVASLLATFAGLLSTYLSRPLGAAIFGHFADRIGRQKTLTITIFGTAAAAALIGVLPSAASIGVAAPVLVVTSRLAMGFFVGGEFPTAGALVLEQSGPRRRAFSASWVQVGAISGSILALLAVTLLSSALPHAALAAWGWRIPFLVAAPLGVVGWFVRTRLTETPQFRKIQEDGVVARAPIVELVTNRQYLGQMLRMLGIFLCGSFFAFYIFLTYVPTYLLGHTQFGARTIFLSALIAQCFMVCVVPFSGWLADRVGRRPILFTAQVLFVVLSVPVFMLMGLRTFEFVLIAQLAIVIPIGLHQGVQNPVMLELLPTRVRVSGGGLAYGIASALFGGTAPLFAVWLVSRTGTGISVALAVIVAAVISFIATLVTAETSHRDLEA